MMSQKWCSRRGHMQWKYFALVGDWEHDASSQAVSSLVGHKNMNFDDTDEKF